MSYIPKNIKAGLKIEKAREMARTYNKTAKHNKAKDGGASCVAGKRWFVEIKS